MYLPLFVEMKGKKVLIVGGGEVALRRGKALSAAGATVTAQAIDFVPGWETLDVTCEVGGYRGQNLSGYDLVIIATDDPAVNGAVLKDARAANVPVNDATAAENGDIIFPATVTKGDYTVAIGSGGKTPFLTRKLKEDIGEILAAYDDEALMALLAETRAYILKNHPETKTTLLRKLARLDVAAIREEGDPHGLTDRLQRE